tara:strand:+ start:12395 stop:13405 length:1011 start_codon:yes stop_codon:yes gene_type:complete
MKDWKKLKALLGIPQKICLVSHPSPDGDSIGSSLAMYWFLIQKKHKVSIITPDTPPKFLSFLEGFNQIIDFEKNREEVETSIEEASIIFCLDFNNLSRLRGLSDVLKQNESAFLVNIDHHQDPEDFAHFQFCFPGTSSTAELVYRFIEELGDIELLNKAIAAAMYTGIVTDTGSFKFSSTEASTHRVAAKLIETGIIPNLIHQNIFDSYSKDRLKLLGFALNERLIFHDQWNTAVIYLSESDLSNFNYQKGDTEGLVNYPLSIENIKFSILITEGENKVKLSLRSKGNFPANKVAETHFSGGGHINAAGGISDCSVEDTLVKIEKLLPNYENELHA